MNDRIITVRGATMSLGRAIELGILRPDELEALAVTAEPDAAPVLVAPKKKRAKGAE